MFKADKDSWEENNLSLSTQLLKKRKNSGLVSRIDLLLLGLSCNLVAKDLGSILDGLFLFCIGNPTTRESRQETGNCIQQVLPRWNANLEDCISASTRVSSSSASCLAFERESNLLTPRLTMRLQY
mmetsp:Transcript_1615/g.2627  ORF Transcript_1615/g.2627 Transcript_1615/m.2627 type:complete len:126 (+) Transcript_1615:396-773(+)